MRLFSRELLLQSYNTATNNTTASTTTSTSNGNLQSNHLQNNHHSHQSSLPPLPSALRSLFLRAGKVMESVLSRVPRIVLYVPPSTPTPTHSSSALSGARSSSSSSSSTSTTSTSTIAHQACKCMLMSNGLNYPDLRVLWKDGTKLKYSLKTGIGGSTIFAVQIISLPL